ncbi:TonB-dependent siderophore receptor [Pseudothauera nasutitermitis]|uniref:TonB-dependent siderophore receptor n=1 Tax=Pseudothauera nasutitermitis TaxID=2565930 RepID=A0A4S4AUL8_9RHOO|nr:TonB-dependent siderophore receptor [Pseudothauera nasutitermitis]THF62931.1 TonB-dependent siderophore receptor [Pseudothauera nasutitermitis]
MTQHCSPRPIALALALALAGALPHGAVAQPAATVSQQNYDLPAGPLAATLNRISREAGLTLTVDSQLVGSRRAAPVRGTLSPEQALHAALAGSDLELVKTTAGTYTLRPAPPATGGETSLKPVTVTATAERSGTTEGTGSYTSGVVTIGKGEQSLREIPQAVSVLTRQQMDDRGVTDIRSALLTAPGVTTVANDPGGHFYSRGFFIQSYQFNGVPLERQLYARGSAFNSDMSIFDRVEIMRGPQGLFEGEGDPSGSINLVRKRPTHALQLGLTAKAGSWERYGAQVDLSGPLNESRTIRGRLIVNYEQADSFRDHIDSKERTVYGAFDIDLGPATTLGFGFSREKPEGTIDWGGLSGYADGSMPHYSRSTNLGARWGHADKTQDTWYADLVHRFNDNWKFKASLVEVRESNDIKYLLRAGRLGPPNTVRGDAYAFDMYSKNLGGDFHVTGDSTVLGRKLALTAGANFSRQRSADLWGWIRNYEELGGAYDRPSVSPEPSMADILAANRMDDGYRSNKKGLYAMGRYQLAEPLSLVLGTRLSSFEQTYVSDGIWGYSASTAKESKKLTPFAGLTYAVNGQWSVYGSYAEIFKPQSQRDVSGSFLAPVSGVSYELGLKGELLGGRVNTAFALFRTKQKNVAFEDGSVPQDIADIRCGGTCYTSSAHLLSQGFEAEVSGEVARGLQLAASYTYTHTRYRSNDVPSVGYDISANTGVPQHIARVWGNYRLPGEWSRWTVGGGLRSQSHSSDFAYFGRTQGGYTLFDARIGYQIGKNLSLALNIDNLTDKKYFQSISYDNNYYGAPRSFLLTLQYGL